MTSWWSNVNPAGANRLAVDGMSGREPTGTLEDGGEHARTGLGKMDDGRDGGCQVERQATHDLSERLDGPR
jgi:hypothetical protein